MKYEVNLFMGGVYNTSEERINLKKKKKSSILISPELIFVVYV